MYNRVIVDYINVYSRIQGQPGTVAVGIAFDSIDRGHPLRFGLVKVKTTLLQAKGTQSQPGL